MPRERARAGTEPRGPIVFSALIRVLRVPAAERRQLCDCFRPGRTLVLVMDSARLSRGLMALLVSVSWLLAMLLIGCDATGDSGSGSPLSSPASSEPESVDTGPASAGAGGAGDDAQSPTSAGDASAQEPAPSSGGDGDPRTIPMIVMMGEQADACPEDPDKLDMGICGCGVADEDTDLDGEPDCVDDCPEDADKTAPGACGCGSPDDDTDGDGAADCMDACPQDAGKVAEGECGCGMPDDDADANGEADCTQSSDQHPEGAQLCVQGGTSDGCDCTGKVVHFVYFVEADATYEERRQMDIEQQAYAFQRYWHEQLGVTFFLNDPVVDVIEAEHDADWYLNTPDGVHGDQRWYRLGNVKNEVYRKLDIRDFDPDHRVVNYPTSRHDGRVGGNFGGAWMDGDDLTCMAGEHGGVNFPYDDGGDAHCLGHVVHEFGHVLGLGHEGPRDDCMQYGFYNSSGGSGMCSFSDANVAKILADRGNDGWFEATPGQRCRAE